ncbi:MAG: acyl--CoA ligase [Ruminococcaceae bacterium]|nr:acyl--CoA ligase [Oscillospiraceae bacterium]
MTTEKKLTGYPSIDKPWLKYYSEEAINAVTPKCSIYENIYNSNKNNLSDVALMFFGKKITYKTLFEEIEKAAKAFVSCGVKCEDNVVICAPAMPETVYSILALNKLGANAVMINPLFSEEQLVARISETEAKVLIVANELYTRVEMVIKKTSIKTVVSCPAVNSLGAVVKMLKKVKKIPGTVTYNDFIKNGKKVSVNNAQYRPNRPAIMVYSSGTTGASKGIQLTNDSINNTIKEGVQIGFEWQRGDRWFSQIPVWFSTGICAQTLVPLKYGITIILEPLYDFELFYEHIIKYKPNFMITACGLLDYLMTKQPYNEAYKEFKFLCAGGEYVTPAAEKKYNDWLKANGNNYGFFKGYGMCECGGTVTASSPKSNETGSAGIPTPNVIVSAFDLVTGKELKYGERGEIRVLTDSRMSGYFKNSTATNEYFKEDEQGRIWACTGDIGYVKEDGSVYVDGRISSSYKNQNDETIYLFDIERAVLDIEKVRQCKAVVSEINGMKTHVAHVALVDGVNTSEVLKEVKIHCEKKLLANHLPTLVKVYNSALPVSASGKLDVAKMENDTSDLIEF